MAGRRIERAWQIAPQHDAQPGPGAVEIANRHCGARRHRIGMASIYNHEVGQPGFDDAAEIHHRHPRRNQAHHAENKGDEHIGQPEFVGQVGKKIDDLRLDRDVECRFVGDDQAWIPAAASN